MRITQSTSNGIAILSVVGNMDLEHHGELTQAFREVSGGDKPRIVLNLSGVTSLSSSGCGAMVSFTRDVSNRGGAVILAALSRQCMDVLELLNLNDFFTIAQSETEALSRFK